MTEFAAVNTLAGPHLLFLILVSLTVEAVVGSMPFLFRIVPHPVVIAGGLVGLLERRLNRESRSEKARLVRGFLVVAVMVALAAGAGYAIAGITHDIAHGWWIEVFFVVTLVAQRSLYTHVRKVGLALQTEGLSAGRSAVSHIVGRDPDSLDEHGVARAAVESCAENFSDGVVAPVFWCALLGLPGLFAYKTVNTMDSMIGHKTKRYLSFGMTAAKLDDVMNFIPARLAGMILVAAAFFVPTANPGRAIGTMLHDARNHSSPNAGWPEGAVAGALDLSLAGPRHYGGKMVKDPWIGNGRARLTVQDIHRTLFLYATACLIQAGIIATLLMTRLAAPGQLSREAETILRTMGELKDLF
jgi:adenosylcobinamide-phosphate synthase